MHLVIFSDDEWVSVEIVFSRSIDESHQRHRNGMNRLSRWFYLFLSVSNRMSQKIKQCSSARRRIFYRFHCCYCFGYGTYLKYPISQRHAIFGGTPVVMQNRESWICIRAGPVDNFAFDGADDNNTKYWTSSPRLFDIFTCSNKWFR